MKNRVSRLVTAALGAAAAALVSACSLLPWGGTYDMEVHTVGNVTSQLQSLYVIVAPKGDVQEALVTSSKYGDLLDEQRMRNYVSFTQYEPLETGSWKLVFEGNKSAFVEQEIDEEVIEVEVDHKLIAKSGGKEFCIVVLGFFGSDGFEQVTVSHTSLDAKASQVVEVGAGSLTLRDE